jgi:hypothetical protein
VHHVDFFQVGISVMGCWGFLKTSEAASMHTPPSPFFPLQIKIQYLRVIFFHEQVWANIKLQEKPCSRARRVQAARWKVLVKEDKVCIQIDRSSIIFYLRKEQSTRLVDNWSMYHLRSVAQVVSLFI